MVRKIEPLRIGELLQHGGETEMRPVFEWVDPASLMVDEVYQRDLSRKSQQLIEKIIGAWSWQKFKPPIVALTPAGYEVIDGQHTALAAATHRGIDLIPVMVIDAPELKERAAAFVGHNRDRVGLNAIQIHYADVAAGDDTAVTIQRVCERAGVNLLRYPPGNAIWAPGETIAIAAIRSLVNRRYAAGARKVLDILSAARCAPVRADAIKAVDVLLNSPEYKDNVTPESITNTMIKMGLAADREAKVQALAHNLPIWKALAIVLYRGGAKSGRGRAAA